MRRALIALAVVIVMMTNLSHRRASIMRNVSAAVEGVDRYVDISVTINVVVADFDGTDPESREWLPGSPRMKIVRQVRKGGMLDTKTTPPSLGPGGSFERQWYASEDQIAALEAIHAPGKPAQLIQGSEGAGKTTVLAQFHYYCWLLFLGEGRQGGQTGPSLERLGAVKAEMLRLFGPDWGRWRELDDFTGFEMCDGTRIRFRYTQQKSKAAGSPIQSYNWSWCGRDEMQDQVEAHGDIQARGRTAPNGYYRQLCTATAKDSPAWRELRDKLEASGLWTRRTLLGPRSPFVHPKHWESMKRTMSEREYKRRVLAMDLPPETATYPDWNRETNLTVVPELGWTDVTSLELRASGVNLQMLVGHDPGHIVDVSLLAKAYVPSPQLANYSRGLFKPRWVIRGEVNTEHGTTEDHLIALLKELRERWRLNLLVRNQHNEYVTNPGGDQALVRADPAGNNDNRTDKTVYTQFANVGLKIKPAAYNANNDGHGRVPREAGVELVNTLIRSASNERRLYVEKFADGSTAAPRLVAALEQSERDHMGRAETSAKGKSDVTHWPAALRYMLWAIERPRLQLVTREMS